MQIKILDGRKSSSVWSMIMEPRWDGNVRDGRQLAVVKFITTSDPMRPYVALGHSRFQGQGFVPTVSLLPLSV